MTSVFRTWTLAACAFGLATAASAQPIKIANIVELAGEAANGALAHVGLTVDAPIPAMRAFRAKFEREWKFTPDHNGIKGYTGVYVLKAAIEEAGKLDRKQLVKEIVPALSAK